MLTLHKVAHISKLPVLSHNYNQFCLLTQLIKTIIFSVFHKDDIIHNAGHSIKVWEYYYENRDYSYKRQTVFKRP